MIRYLQKEYGLKTLVIDYRIAEVSHINFYQNRERIEDVQQGLIVASGWSIGWRDCSSGQRVASRLSRATRPLSEGSRTTRPLMSTMNVRTASKTRTA